jgi:hypothetical protein
LNFGFGSAQSLCVESFSIQNTKSEIQDVTMLVYVLIGLCLSLAGVAGLQLMYMFYIDRIDKERKKRVHELEIENKRLLTRLAEAESELETKNEMLSAGYPEYEDEEAWADLIDER